MFSTRRCAVINSLRTLWCDSCHEWEYVTPDSLTNHEFRARMRTRGWVFKKNPYTGKMEDLCPKCVEERAND